MKTLKMTKTSKYQGFNLKRHDEKVHLMIVIFLSAVFLYGAYIVVRNNGSIPVLLASIFLA